MSDQFSVRVDRLRIVADPVAVTIATLERPLPVRKEAALILSEILCEFVANDVCSAHLRIEGLPREDWDEIAAPEVTGWMKRETIRGPAGVVIATVEYATDEERTS